MTESNLKSVFNFIDHQSNNHISIEDIREVIAREGRKL